MLRFTQNNVIPHNPDEAVDVAEIPLGYEVTAKEEGTDSNKILVLLKAGQNIDKNAFVSFLPTDNLATQSASTDKKHVGTALAAATTGQYFFAVVEGEADAKCLASAVGDSVVISANVGVGTNTGAATVKNAVYNSAPASGVSKVILSRTARVGIA